MTVRAVLSDEGRTKVLRVEGRFDFNMHREFREAYQDDPPGLAYEVDLAGAEYLDSSALGMLLLLREHAGGDGARVRLRGCRPAVRRILEIANFHELFQID